jgi:hypothetical protein
MQQKIERLSHMRIAKVLALIGALGGLVVSSSPAIALSGGAYVLKYGRVFGDLSNVSPLGYGELTCNAFVDPDTGEYFAAYVQAYLARTKATSLTPAMDESLLWSIRGFVAIGSSPAIPISKVIRYPFRPLDSLAAQVSIPSPGATSGNFYGGLAETNGFGEAVIYTSYNVGGDTFYTQDVGFQCNQISVRRCRCSADAYFNLLQEKNPRWLSRVE